MRVPFCDIAALNATMADELFEAYERVMAAGQFILGPELEAFEQEWAAYCGKRYCVGVGNGLDALRLMLEAYHIGPGDQVIVPTNTYIATWLAVSAVGATIVPVEPDDVSGTLCPDGVAHAMNPSVKAVLAVHLYGRQADVRGLQAVAPKAVVLTDAAQGHGLRELGACGAFSFYPTKNLGGLGDGGAIVTDDELVATRVRRARNYGQRAKNDHAIVGGNSRLDELQAAFLRVRLAHLNKMNARRRSIARLYDEALPRGLARVWRGRPDVLHLYVAELDPSERDEIRARLAKLGVWTAVHYPTPPHLQPAYAQLGYRDGAFPVAEGFARRALSLPIGPELTDEQVGHVVHAAAVAVGMETAA